MKVRILFCIGFLTLIACNQKLAKNKNKHLTNNVENDLVYEFQGKNKFILLLKELTPKASKKINSWKVVMNDTLNKTFRNVTLDSLWTAVHLEVGKLKTEKPKNAKLVFKEGNFSFTAPYDGNEFITEKLKSVFLSTLKNKRPKVDLVKEGCYNVAKYRGDESTCSDIIKLAKKKSKLKLTFEHSSESIELKGKELSELLTTNDNMELIVNQQKAYRFGAKMARKLDVIQSPVSFIAASGQLRTVSKSEIGRRVNVQKIITLISEAIDKDADTKVEVPFIMKGIPNELLTTNRNHIEINLNEQKIFFFKNDTIALSSDIVTGRANTSFATPAGAYFIRYKATNTTLDGPGYSCFVRYFMPIFNGIGLHDAGWRRKFGGSIYQRDGSHGCINLPRPVAEFAYNNYPSGTIVICH
jgi:hypothetical protein